jgi:hypothetical protein
MTRDKIQQLAREADPEYGNADGLLAESMCGIESIERFAGLVLEEAARVCDEAEVGLLAVYEGRSEVDPLKKGKRSEYVLGGVDQSDLLADAIRALKPEA